MSYQPTPPKKSNTGLWLGGAAILLVALIAVVVLLLNRQSGPAAPVSAVIISAATATPEPEAATLAAVNTPTSAPTETPTSTPMPELGTSNLFIEYILDASGSMSETLRDGSPKIEVAQQVLTEHMRSFRPETNIGLRVYGHRLPYQQTDESCQDIELIAPPEKGQMERIASWLQDFTVQGMTPLAASLEMAREDFVYDASRVNSIVMLSDGIETCGGDPCQLVEDLKAEGINFTIHVIGLDVDDPTRQQLTCIAEAGDGTYHDAKSQDDLNAALGAVKEDVTRDEVVVPPGVNTPTPAPSPTSAPAPTSTPTPPAALPPGTFSLVGYYMSIERTAWDVTKPCDVLVVVDGSQDLIQEYLDSIDGGNTVNSKNSLNQPEVNIDLSVVSPGDLEAIKASTVDQPIQLVVSKPPPRGMGAPVCFSMIEIKDVVPIDGNTTAPLSPADGIAEDWYVGRFSFSPIGPSTRSITNPVVHWTSPAMNCIPCNLTNSPDVYDSSPSWSPDGSSIVFASMGWREAGARTQIMKIDVATGEVTQLTTQGNNTVPLWVKLPSQRLH